jgi:phosphoribosylamine--glycine ligase
MTKTAIKKILVIGSGGREHAICEAFKNSAKIYAQPCEIFIIPGNAGTSKIAKNIEDIEVTDFAKIIKFCQDWQIDFVFVGPEQPLTAGIVDELQKNKIAVFGPSKKAAQLEGSKIFMKKIADENNIPTAFYQSFSDEKSAIKFIKEITFPCVIKTDGLASGKGVIIAQNFDEAQKNISEIFQGKFGEAGKKIIIEEFLNGFEVSYFVICDGNNFLPLGFAHDHKKVGEGETGLNTGGMGSFSPSNKINEKLETKIIETIIKPTLQGMSKIGSPFCGILFAGLMINGEDVKLLEFNIRLGDPETQVLLPRLNCNFIELIESSIAGNLNQFTIKFFEEKKLVCVVICAKGYPQDYRKGSEIKNLTFIEEQLSIDNGDSLKILHAGTVCKNGKIYANGGRVLNVVASASSFEDARKKAYELIDKINWQDGFARSDIAFLNLL